MAASIWHSVLSVACCTRALPCCRPFVMTPCKPRQTCASLIRCRDMGHHACGPCHFCLMESPVSLWLWHMSGSFLPSVKACTRDRSECSQHRCAQLQQVFHGRSSPLEGQLGRCNEDALTQLGSPALAAWCTLARHRLLSAQLCSHDTETQASTVAYKPKSQHLLPTLCRP